jgi:hypothetical protein
MIAYVRHVGGEDGCGQIHLVRDGARQLRGRLEHRLLALEPQDAGRMVALPRLDAMVHQQPTAVRSDRLAVAADRRSTNGTAEELGEPPNLPAPYLA